MLESMKKQLAAIQLKQLKGLWNQTVGGQRPSTAGTRGRSGRAAILDWQKNSVLLARGRQVDSTVSLQDVSWQPMGPQSDLKSISPRQAVINAAQQSHIKGDVTVLVARELVELRTVQIPRVEADELPDIVRFQAQRQFSGLTEAWCVDFMMLPSSAGLESQTALIATMPPSQIAEIESACSAAGLQIAHIALRPLEMARLAMQTRRVSTTGCSMIVSVADGVAELSLLREGRVVQVRSTKLPTQADQCAVALQGEVRRSLLAASNELAGQSLESVLLVAAEDVAKALVDPVSQATGTATDCYHPESLLTKADGDLVQLAASRLAAMAGALSLESADPNSVIDFKHPKRRPPKQRNTRTWVLAAGAAAAVLILGLGWYSLRIRSLNAEFADYQQQIADKTELGAASDAKLIVYRTVEEFLDSSPNWLDEMAYIARRMPPASQVKLGRPEFTVRDGRASITLDIQADSSASITAFANSIRSPHHIVSGKGANQLENSEDGYRWSESVVIQVTGKTPPEVPEDAKQEVQPVSNQQQLDVQPDDQIPSGESIIDGTRDVTTKNQGQQ
ncbi:MAG: hypothetical protein KF752_03355 [Pirellulaceae bacterium]|nr:hypothetical protein [Pirellulaceae bacterium]